MKDRHLVRGNLLFVVIMILMAGVLTLLPRGNAAAATVTVQSALDGAANAANCPGASCRLRDAIAAASSGDTIDFNLPAPSTITLSITPLIITKNLTITGPGTTSLYIDGNHLIQVFSIGAVTVNISALTISNGASVNPGGGIGAIGGSNLTLTRVALIGNQTAGIGGGGIYSPVGATVTVTDCTFSGNQALPIGNGGGILSSGILTITNSTLSGNSAPSGYGGGIYNAGILTMTNSTLSGNSTTLNGGGIYTLGSSALLTNVTLSGNSATQGGGIYTQTYPAALRNTIVANSTLGGNCFGVITSLGHNLEYGGAPTCGFNVGLGDIIGSDPQLSALTLNPPGTTQTMALSSTSPAIDAGDNANLPPTDQRGAFRIWDGDGNGSAIADIGAYEYGAPLYTPPTVPAINGWGMIIFILLAGLGSVYYLKKRRRAEG